MKKVEVMNLIYEIMCSNRVVCGHVNKRVRGCLHLRIDSPDEKEAAPKCICVHYTLTPSLRGARFVNPLSEINANEANWK